MVMPSVFRCLPASLLGAAIVARPALAQAELPDQSATPFLLIGGLLALVFGAVAFWMIRSGLQSRALARESLGWPTAGGKILSSEVLKQTRRRKGGTSTEYHPSIRYAFQAMGAPHEGSTIRFGSVSSARESVARGYVTKYPAGSTCVVRYKPGDPSVATLETAPAGMREIVVGVIFLLVPIFILAMGTLVMMVG